MRRLHTGVLVDPGEQHDGNETHTHMPTERQTRDQEFTQEEWGHRVYLYSLTNFCHGHLHFSLSAQPDY